MNKEIKEKIIEIIYETSAFGKKSERFQEVVDQILELFQDQLKDIKEGLPKERKPEAGGGNMETIKSENTGYNQYRREVKEFLNKYR